MSGRGHSVVLSPANEAIPPSLPLILSLPNSLPLGDLPLAVLVTEGPTFSSGLLIYNGDLEET